MGQKITNVSSKNLIFMTPQVFCFILKPSKINESGGLSTFLLDWPPQAHRHRWSGLQGLQAKGKRRGKSKGFQRFFSKKIGFPKSWEKVWKMFFLFFKIFFQIKNDGFHMLSITITVKHGVLFPVFFTKTMWLCVKKYRAPKKPWFG